MSRKFYFSYQLHTNFWYAEFTHDQAVRQFSSSFEELLKVIKKHEVGACWDWETSISLQMLSLSSPNFISDLNELVDDGINDIVPCSWGNTLATHHTFEEFVLNYNITMEEINKYFNRVSPCWISQDGAWSPQYVEFLKAQKKEYILLDQKILNRYYKDDYTLEERFNPCFMQGVSHPPSISYLEKEGLKMDDDLKMPAIIFGIEGTTSASNLPEIVERRINKLPDDGDYLIYPFVDTERINPSLFDKWMTKIEDLGGEYTTPSKYLKDHPLGSTSPIRYFDVGDWHDWSYHNDIANDQYLWTLVERARTKIAEASFWLEKVHSNKKYFSHLKGEDISKLEKMREKALQSVIMAQSSDKSHWYASLHKLEVGRRYAVAAYEKASYICGVLSRVYGKYHPEFKDRFHFMKDPDFKITILNNNKQEIPQNYPLIIPFPYITVVNLNTKPSYIVQNQYEEKTCPTTFNIVPDLMVHNLRTELFYQLKETLTPNELLKMELKASDHEVSPIYNESELTNSHFRLMFKDGDIEKIVDKSTSYVFESGSDASLITPFLNIHLMGIQDDGFDIEDIDSDLDNSLLIARKAKNEKVDLVTKYRVFKDFPGFLIDSYISFLGSLPGEFAPINLNWKEKIIQITRECLDESISTKNILPKQIFMNDWAVLTSKSEDTAGLAIGFVPEIFSCKMILHNDLNDWKFGYMRNFPEWVALQLLNGVIHQRIWVIPFVGDSAKNQATNLIKQLIKPPSVLFFL